MTKEYRSVGNFGEEAAVISMAETSPSSPLSSETRVEVVPGYRPRSLAIASVEAANASPGPRIRSASMGAFRNRELLEVVIGDDDRQAIPDVTIPPWRFICALRIKTATNRSFVGTGWLIGRRTVMTAGHCVFMHDEGGWVKSIEVIPALNGAARPFGAIVSTRFNAIDRWTADRNSDFDFGAIVLDEPIGDEVGWFAFAALDETRLRSTLANISGYPLDRDSATRQYFHARQIVRVSSRRISYDIDTYGGQSGSPVWLQINNQRVAVGVHTNGSSTANSGTLINHELFECMKRWKQ
jgi:glutamyl endopeptidase